MNVQEQIKEWCKDGRFLRYANERMRKEITEVPENHVVTPEYEALDEGFEYDDRYAAPLAAYLTYRLQMAKLQKKAKVRKRGIWWVFVQVMTLGHYVHVFSDEFGALAAELQETVMPMLHDEYVMISRGMCHHQRIEHLDSQDNGVGCTEKGVRAGRQRAHSCQPYHDG